MKILCREYVKNIKHRNVYKIVLHIYALSVAALMGNILMHFHETFIKLCREAVIKT